MSHRFSHVAVTVPADQLDSAARSQLLHFYGEVFGWHENPGLAIPGQRIFLRAPSDSQCITIRAWEAPMRTSGYEHLGIRVDSVPELTAIHERAAAMASRLPDAELHPIRFLYGGSLLSFRVRFRLPLTIEVQHLRPAAQAIRR